MKEFRDAAKSAQKSKISSYGGKTTGMTFDDKGSFGAAPVDSSQENRKPEGSASAKPTYSARYGGAVGIRRYDRKPRAAGGRVPKADGGYISPIAPIIGDINDISKLKEMLRQTTDWSDMDRIENRIRQLKEQNTTSITRKSGGRATHPDVVEDKKLVNKMVKPECRTKRADGGGVFGEDKPEPKKNAKGTTVNIVISGNPSAGAGGDAPRPPMPPVMPPPAPPMMPPAPPAGLGAMGGPPMGPGGAGAMGAPPLMRKAGGRVTSPSGMTAGALSGEGRLQKIELQKSVKNKG